MIPLDDGKKLLILAKDAIKAHFNRKEITVPSELREKYSENQGVFVTLMKDFDLRGCIGFPEPIMPLVEGIIKAAQSAGFEDPRFEPLQKQELKEITFEISVLTQPEKINGKPADYPKEIKIGRDGLIIRGSYGSGLLLPQVFTEYKCDPVMALEMTCQKAGMAADAWKDPSNSVYKFSAQIFMETSDGEVKEKEI